jgi:hypothetical protein
VVKIWMKVQIILKLTKKKKQDKFLISKTITQLKVSPL